MKILGTGIDIIEVDRIENAIKRWGDGFLKHVFTENEIAYVKKHKFPNQHYAVRFAAKEAVYKALGLKDVSWKNIEILNDKEGRPYCRFLNKKIQKKVFISLSHSEHYAVANAIVSSK